MKILLYAAAFVLLDAIVPAGCRGDRSRPRYWDPPVSDETICNDWYNEFRKLDENATDSTLPRPSEYWVLNLENDELDEILVRGEDDICYAMLAYNAEGELVFADATNDGYQELGWANGWYLTRYDDHMGEYRTWTTSYYKIENGKFDYVGEKTVGLKGLDEEGEPISYEEDGTNGQAPADSLVTMFYEMDGWMPLIVTEPQ